MSNGYERLTRLSHPHAAHGHPDARASDEKYPTPPSAPDGSRESASRATDHVARAAQCRDCGGVGLKATRQIAPRRMPSKRARDAPRAARNFDRNTANDASTSGASDAEGGAGARRGSDAVRRILTSSDATRACAAGDWSALRKLNDSHAFDRLSLANRMRVLLSAVYGGQVDVLDWLLTTKKLAFTLTPCFDDDVNLALDAYEWDDFNASHAACLRYFVECGKRVLVLDRFNPMRFAVERGDVERCHALRQFDCPWQSDAIICASGRGDLRMLEYLFDSQCPENRKRFCKSAIAEALRRGYLDCVKFLYDRRFSWTCDEEILDALGDCCERGDLTSIQWCEERGARLDVHHVIAAASASHFDVTRHLLERRYVDEEDMKKVFTAAATSRQTKMVEFLTMHQLKPPNAPPFDAEAPMETLDEFKAMFARLGEKFIAFYSQHFVLLAFALGDLPLLQHVHENMNVPWDDKNIAKLIALEDSCYKLHGEKSVEFVGKFKHYPCLHYALTRRGMETRIAMRKLLSLDRSGYPHDVTLARLQFLKKMCGVDALPWSTSEVIKFLQNCGENDRIRFNGFMYQSRTHYGPREKFLIDHCELSADVLTLVAESANYALVEALVDRQCPMNHHVLVSAISKVPNAGAEPIVRFLIQKGCPVHADCFVEAARVKSVEICNMLLRDIAPDQAADFLDARFLPQAVHVGSLECMNFGFQFAAPHDIRALLATAHGTCRQALLALVRYQDMYGDTVLGKKLNPKEQKLLFKILDVVQEQSTDFSEGEYVEVCAFLQGLYNQK